MRRRRGSVVSIWRAIPTWSCAEGAASLSLVSGMALLVERHDLDPVRALAGRSFTDGLECARRRVDGVDRQRLGLFPGGDEKFPLGVDREAARLLLRRR